MPEEQILPTEAHSVAKKQPWTTPTLKQIEIAGGTEYGSSFTDDGDGPGWRSGTRPPD